MFTTRCANGFRARPLEARPDRKDGLIWFVTDLHSAKESEIELGTMWDLFLLTATPMFSFPLQRVPKWRAIRPRRPKSGRAPIICGGADRTIQTWACFAFGR